MKRKIRLLLFFLFITSAFLLLNYSITTLWGETYVDMSGNQSHTLSEASKQILNDLKIKQTIRLYISPQIAKDYPQTSQYSRYVADLLKRYAKQSGGKLSFEQIEIEPYSKEEDDAKAYGLKTFLSRDGKINLYFGAVIFNENGEERVIPNFVELRRPYLENDISEIIYRLSKTSSKNTIGLIAPEWNLYYTANGFLDGNKNLNILNKLSENYNIQVISEYALQIGLNINTLILVNPSHDLPNVSRYALDQFVLRGGNLIILTDAVDERTHLLNNDKKINQLLKNWGITFSSEITIGNLNAAESILLNGKQIKYPTWLAVKEDAFNQESPLTRNLKTLIFRSPAGIKINEKQREGVKVTPLVTLQKYNTEIDSRFIAKNYKHLVPQESTITSALYHLAVMIEGTFYSNYTQNIIQDEKAKQQMLPFLIKSVKEGKIFVISDIDFVYDENYADNSFKEDNPIYGVIPWANNGDFFLKLVEYANQNEVLTRFTPKSILPQTGLEEDFKKQAEQNFTLNLQTEQQKLDSLQGRKNSINLQTNALGNVKEYNELETQISEQEKKIRHIEYQIDKQYRAKINNFILWNLLAILGVLTLIIVMCRHQIKKRRFYKSSEKE